MRSHRLFVLFTVMLLGIVVGAVATQAEVITLTYAHTDNNPALGRMVELFNESHDDVQVEFIAIAGFDEAIPVQVAAGTGPDVFYTHPKDMGAWSRGVLLDLTPFAERDPELAQLEQYFPVALDLSRVDGRLYALPYGILETGRVLYNVDMLASAGLADPEDDWTWDDYRELARRLTVDPDGDGEPTQYGTSGFGWREIVHYVIEEGGRFFSEDFQVFLPDRAPTVQAFEFAAGLHLDGLVAPSGVSDFINGDVAFLLTHLPGAIDYGNRASANFQVASTIQPQHVNGERRFFVSGNMLGINPNISEAHQDAAWKFVSWVNSPEGYAQASREMFGACQLYPARRDAALSQYCMDTAVPGLRPEVSLDIIAHFSMPEVVPPTWSTVLSTFNAEWTNRVVSGEMAPVAFYDAVIETINAGLRQ